MAASSLVVSVADAVAGVLKDAADLSQAIEPERSYADWDDQLPDVGVLHVDVVPRFKVDIEQDSRDTEGWQVGIDVGVRKRFGTSDTEQTSGKVIVEQVDELVVLVEQIASYLVGERLAAVQTATNAVWRSTSIEALYVRDHLRQWSQYTGYVRLVFDCHKTRGVV